MRKRIQFKRVAGVTGLATLALAGVLAGVFLPAGAAGTKAADATTRVTVKASEFKYVFSKRSVPTGTVIFTVINKGKISHDFKIGGKKTKTLLPGKAAKLTVKFTKKGQYAFLCTIFGHAKAGMKGKYAVATKPVATTTTKTTTPTDDDDAAADGPDRQREHDRSGGDVRVRLQPLAAVGPVGPGHLRDQEQRQRGAQLHRPGCEGRRLAQPRRRRRPTRSGLPAQRFSYVCDVPFHIDRGMLGSLTVNP